MAVCHLFRNIWQQISVRVVVAVVTMDKRHSTAPQPVRGSSSTIALAKWSCTFLGLKAIDVAMVTKVCTHGFDEFRPSWRFWICVPHNYTFRKTCRICSFAWNSLTPAVRSSAAYNNFKNLKSHILDYPTHCDNLLCILTMFSSLVAVYTTDCALQIVLLTLH